MQRFLTLSPCHLVTLSLLLLLSPALPCPACPFCAVMSGPSLTGEVDQAKLVVYGTLSNAKADPTDLSQGSTDLSVEIVIKPHDILGDKKLLVLPRFLPLEDKETRFLAFCDVYKGKLDPYRGFAVKKDSDLLKYIKGAIAVKDKPATERVRFFFDYLENPESEISIDAYKEFSRLDYKDYCKLAKTLPADTVVKWLENPKTSSSRYGLYGSMLGHCGEDKHAEVLKKMLDDPKRKLLSGVDGVMAGYVLLRPKEGWDYVVETIKSPKKEFMQRFAALRAARFFWDYRPDVIDKKRVVEAISPLLDQSDFSDLVIEDLRKWSAWEKRKEVLELFGKESHSAPIIKRAIIRYALCCPDKEAKDFVDGVRKKDADLVNDVEEFLKLEQGTKDK